MSFRAFWFVVAGFVLGFTVSTLWEWLYYRQKRSQHAAQGQAAISEEETLDSASYARGNDAFDVDSWTLPAYRSSGVLLESETDAPPSGEIVPSRSLDSATADIHSTANEQMSTPVAELATTTDTSEEESAEALTVAALTSQHLSQKGERTTPSPAQGKAANKAAATEQRAEAEQLPSALHGSGTLATETADRSQRARPSSPLQMDREEQESLGNPEAIARAGALAAALYHATESRPTHTASAVTATPGENRPESSEATSAAAANEAAATASSTNASTHTASSDQPTRTVATHGFAEQSPRSGDSALTSPPAKGSPTGTDATVIEPIVTQQTERPPTGTTDALPRPQRERPADYPDDLAMIKGIGEAYKRRLYATGIYTWRQLAEAEADSLRRITRAKPNANIDSWVTQALELAEKYKRTAANFTGPLDDFTRIEGIGAITADILYKAGICTYEELAGALPDDLTRIVPAPTVGNENDFDSWIRDAARLAGAKRRNNGLLP